jgi:hypothetical protein
MQSHDKFSFLRTVLRTIGLSAEAIDDIVERITDWLTGKDKPPVSPVTATDQPIIGTEELPEEEISQYPYFVRDDFLSAAEQSFYLVLNLTVGDKALVCPKVSLGDLFWAKSNDASEYRSLTNKIDRKHVDFLLCDPKTVHPLVGIELDDRSHKREDRQQRDEFVGQVFAAAKLPLVRVPAKHAYSVPELAALLQPHIELPVEAPAPKAQPGAAGKPESSPLCPKCGGEMLLRTVRSGANQGGKFWGCSNYPRCRGIVQYADEAEPVAAKVS